jgi:hypothetical protein
LSGGFRSDGPSNLSSANKRRVWMVRAGRGAIYADRFLSAGFVAIGFGVRETIAGRASEDLSSLIRRLLPAEPPTAIGLHAGALFRMANDIAIGDYVLTPEPSGALLAGEVVGPYEFVADSPIPDHPHLRRVRWFGRVDRGTLSTSARGSLGAIMALFLPGFQEELVGLLEPISSHPAPTPRSSQRGVQRTDQPFVPVPETLPDPPSPISSEFETDKRNLLFLLDLITNRDLALPDFQRSFVWDATATRDLIVSIVRGFPAGSLLFLRGGSVVFLPRAVEEAPALNGHQPSSLVLDGQQRLSSLFQAFSGVGSHRFFVDVAAILNGEDIDGAVKAYSVQRASAWLTTSGQAQSLMFPLWRVRDYAYWRDEVLEERPADDANARKRLRMYLNRIESAVVTPIKSYQFPVTTLSEQTPTEAVCTIFETLNRTGIKLSVFELICARAFAENQRLRERWADSIVREPILEDFHVDPYYILQAIALRTKRKPQRGVVAAMEVRTIVEEWTASVRGMAQALVMLRDECGVLTEKWLPYAPMLPTLAAAWRDIDEASGPTVGARRLKLQRWFWCACFSGDYDNSPNSRAEADVPRLHKWLCGSDPPEVVQGFQFDAPRWLDITARQRGLYRSTMALLMRRRPLDLHKAIPLTRTVIESNAVDDHHIFPAAYLAEQGLSGQADTVLNHTLIDKLTNIRIGKKAPSVYLADMESEMSGVLANVLSSHCLPAEKDGPLWRNDYDGFLAWRLERLVGELSLVTGDPLAQDAAL